MSRQKGNIGEDIATSFLIENGFEILQRNFYCRYGEVDIIATKNNILHFVEVKSGNNFAPILNITPKKIEKLTKTIDCYLIEKGAAMPYVLDAICISSNKIELIENITI